MVSLAFAVALQETWRAQRHLAEARALAHDILTEYPEQIAELPGSLPVQERMVRDAILLRDAPALAGEVDDAAVDAKSRELLGKDLDDAKYAEALQFDWGKPIDPAAVRAALATGKFDCITFIHSETSTGTLSPIADIMAVVREFPDVISIADTVSSFSTIPIKKDELGIDIFLTGSQKALALPPGLAIFAVSERARERAKQSPDRGYYFDLIEFHDNHVKGMTPSTPCISLFYGLQQRLLEVEAEGLENRYARHLRLNERMRAWGLAKGFSLLPEVQFGTRGLNCFKNDRNADLERLNKTLKSRHKLVIDGGYGKLKGKTFRISNMGDETDATIATLIAALDDSFAEQGM